MKFSEDIGNALYRITGYGEGWVKVNQEMLQHSFLLGPQTLNRDWEPKSLQELEPRHLDPLFELGAEVIIIGSDPAQNMPSPAVWRALVQNGVGFEIMGNDAACRTYNILLSETRRVAAAFLLR